MLVYIESYFGDSLISGKRCTEKELREKFNRAVKLNEGGDFPALFCRMFEFEELPLSQKIQVDYIMDLDTHRVYMPHY